MAYAFSLRRAQVVNKSENHEGKVLHKGPLCHNYHLLGGLTGGTWPGDGIRCAGSSAARVVTKL
jgi:hypothetical protein